MSAPARIGAIVQARLGSTRLPGKVLLPLPLGQATTVLDHVIARARRAEKLHTVVLATSDEAADDALATAAEAVKLPIFRGAEQDVLSRFAEAAAAFDLDIIIRLTADNLAIDPTYIDLAVERHLATGADYTITTGLPLGTNLEVISRAALQQANAQATAPDEREHVTPYLRRRPELFRLLQLNLPCPAGLADCRLTLDYPSDYALLHLLYTELPQHFTLAEAGQLFLQRPWLRLVNGQNEQVKV